jgi:hypothetical protein
MTHLAPMGPREALIEIIKVCETHHDAFHDFKTRCIRVTGAWSAQMADLTWAIISEKYDMLLSPHTKIQIDGPRQWSALFKAQVRKHRGEYLCIRFKDIRRRGLPRYYRVPNKKL